MWIECESCRYKEILLTVLPLWYIWICWIIGMQLDKEDSMAVTQHRFWFTDIKRLTPLFFSCYIMCDNISDFISDSCVRVVVHAVVCLRAFSVSGWSFLSSTKLWRRLRRSSTSQSVSTQYCGAHANSHSNKHTTTQRCCCRGRQED